MVIRDAIVAVTGGGHGLGKALCRRFAAGGARSVAVIDLDGDAASAVAEEIGGSAHAVDVSDETALSATIREIEARHGGIDLFCSNAGVGFDDGEATDATGMRNELWQRSWEVNVMAQVYAARALLPGMIERGSGHIINVASAAGLLSQIGGTAYSATKHASVGFTESLAITHGDAGIRVSLVCPQAIATAMIGMPDEPTETVELKGIAGNDVDGVLWPHEAADLIAEGIEADRFLILTHPAAGEYFQRKAADYDRWIGGMRKLRRGVLGPSS